jgi:nicotinamidase-related amidase
MAARSLTPNFVQNWLKTLNDAELADVAPDPRRTAVFSSDVIYGFLREGPLSSERVDGITNPLLSVFEAAWEHGVRDFVLLQDAHSEETPEFRVYPPHCVAGSEESRTIPELEKLPFADHLRIIEKNSLSPALGTRFQLWLDEHPELKTAIVVGDCTDLCVYQLAMYLRMRADALNILEFDVIVPMDAVQTFDIPVADAQDAIIPHPGDFFHEVFLYHMASNGIRIVNSLRK